MCDHARSNGVSPAQGAASRNPLISSLAISQRLPPLPPVAQFAAIRTHVPVSIPCADSYEAPLPPCDMVFTSAPYVGLIDYHQHHRYAYELLSLIEESFASVGWIGSDLRGNEERGIAAAREGLP